MEVMGLMLGEFVDEYTVRVVDVFAMPQSGTGVSVEAVDHVFQTNMLDMLKQTGRFVILFCLGFSFFFWNFWQIWFPAARRKMYFDGNSLLGMLH